MTEFVDTNILLYAHGINAATEPCKVKKAADFIKERWLDIFITWQVLVEFGANLHRKSSLSVGDKANLIRRYSILMDADAPNHPEQVEIALKLCQESDLSYWDANIIAAVAAQGGRILYSEDMQDGATYHGVVVKNPLVQSV